VNEFPKNCFEDSAFRKKAFYLECLFIFAMAEEIAVIKGENRAELADL